jgi:nucleoside-diphosphate-sugar epimerase
MDCAPVPSASIERHVAQSVRLALEADLEGADYFNISAADTAMERPSRDLMAEVFHDVLGDGGVTGTDTLMSIDKAHRLLGYTPDFT